MSIFGWGDRLARIERHIKEHPDPVLTCYMPIYGDAGNGYWTSYEDNLRGHWYRTADERHEKLVKELAELRGLLACHKIKDRRNPENAGRRFPDRRTP